MSWEKMAVDGAALAMGMPPPSSLDGGAGGLGGLMGGSGGPSSESDSDLFSDAGYTNQGGNGLGFGSYNGGLIGLGVVAILAVGAYFVVKGAK